MEIAFIFLCVIIIFASVMLMREIGMVRDNAKETKSQFETQIAALEKRIAELEKAIRTRMPYDALEKLEHARAALNREKEERLFHVSLIENAEAWLQKVMATGTKRSEE